MRLRRILVILMVAALVGTACQKKQNTGTSASPEASPTAATSPTPSAAAGAQFKMDLTGAEEKPGPGDTDGKGTAQLTLDEANKQVCYKLEFSSIGSPTKAHIHEGAKGIAGGIVVTLTETPFKSEGCVSADAALIARIESQPQNFYVNIHNDEFPNGAIRGQLPASPTGGGGNTPTGSATPTTTTTSGSTPLTPGGGY